MLGPEAKLATSLAKGGTSKMALTAGGGVLFAALSTLKPCGTIKEGHVGVKTRFGQTTKHTWYAKWRGSNGQPYGTLQPGFHVFPAHRVRILSTMDEPDDFVVKKEIGTGKDKENWLVHSSIMWRINPDGDNPRKTFTKIENDADKYSKAIVGFCASAMIKVLDGIDSPEKITEATIGPRFIEQIKDDQKLEDYGAELRVYNLVEAQPVDGEFMVRALSKYATMLGQEFETERTSHASKLSEAGVVGAFTSLAAENIAAQKSDI